MATFVRLQEDFPAPGLTGVVEVITTKQDINTLYHPDFVKSLVDVTSVKPMPKEWWTYDGANFQPPAA